MAELHDSLLAKFRKRCIKNKFKECKTPMPEFRPDFFGRKYSEQSKIIEEIVVEVEIKATLYYEHTSTQLVLMDQYISYKKRQGIKVIGYLLIPRSKEIFGFAISLLDSLFPIDNKIKICQL